jgi:hypothetical protein
MLTVLPRPIRKIPLLILAGSALLGACAAPAAPYRSPDHWSKNGYEWPPGSGQDTQKESLLSPSPTASRAKEFTEPDEPYPAPPAAGDTPYVGAPAPTNAPLHEGQKCLRALRKSGVTFRSLGSLKGVENPVEVQGRLGGVVFYATDRRPLQLDCRLALALEDLRPVFQQHGVTRVRFSGAYSYRRTRSGRLSHHAHGLAIDLHDLEFGPKSLSVEGDFARRVGCSSDNPPLNRLACAMRDRRLFEEFLTPDFNFDHRDHLHISVPRRS